MTTEKREESCIGPQMTIRGQVETRQPVVVVGSIKGVFRAASVHLAQAGVLDGEIHCDEIESYGTLKGCVEAESLNLYRGSRQYGSARVQHLAVERGAMIDCLTPAVGWKEIQSRRAEDKKRQELLVSLPRVETLELVEKFVEEGPGGSLVFSSAEQTSDFSLQKTCSQTVEEVAQERGAEDSSAVLSSPSEIAGEKKRTISPLGILLRHIFTLLESGKPMLKVQGALASGRAIPGARLLSGLPSRYIILEIKSPEGSTRELLGQIYVKLGCGDLEDMQQPTRDLLAAIRNELSDRHAAERKVVLVIEHAERMYQASMERLVQLLTPVFSENCDGDGEENVLQLVLFGSREMEGSLVSNVSHYFCENEGSQLYFDPHAPTSEESVGNKALPPFVSVTS